MARIRTIKPEFPQSESMGRVSRDARLCFILLWTIADDSGRGRGSSRMLASLLFPYDDDAPRLIDGWLEELERESCIVRYSHNGASYLQICNWLANQKIDKPSASKFPAFAESSRTFAKPREHSSEDQGMDQGGEGKGREASRGDSNAPPPPPETPITDTRHKVVKQLDLTRLTWVDETVVDSLSQWCHWIDVSQHKRCTVIEIKANLADATRKGWDASKVVASIQFSIAKRAKSWLDPDNDFDAPALRAAADRDAPLIVN